MFSTICVLSNRAIIRNTRLMTLSFPMNTGSKSIDDNKEEPVKLGRKAAQIFKKKQLLEKRSGASSKFLKIQEKKLQTKRYNVYELMSIRDLAKVIGAPCHDLLDVALTQVCTYYIT